MAGLLSNMATKFSALGQDKEMLGALGQGLLTGGTFGEQLGNAFGNAGALRSQKKQELAEQAKANKTLEFLRQANPQLAQAVEAGALSSSDAYKMHLSAAKPQQTEFEMRAAAAQQYGMDPNSAEGRAFILGDKYIDPNAPQANDRSMVGIPMQDAKGNWVMGQLDSGGNLNPAKVPEGYTVASPYDKAAGSAQGKAEGVIRAALPTAKATADRTASLVDEVLNDEGLNQSVGPVDGRLPSFRPAAVRFDEKVKQLQGRAFLEARQMLKGGGQITDYEGQRAELAMARMSQAKSEDDFKAALLEFKSAVQDGYAKLEAAYGGGQPTQAPAQPGGNKTSSGVTWTVVK